MKNLILKITRANWGQIGPGDWTKSEWLIYSNHLTEMTTTFTTGIEPEVSAGELTEEEFNHILQNIELAKSSGTKVDAFDGEAWEFIQYHNGQEVWKRAQGYIYGIKPLENITRTLLQDFAARQTQRHSSSN